MEMKDTTAEDVIEEVKGAQLRKMVEELDFLVVFFCKLYGTLMIPSADSELLAAAVSYGLGHDRFYAGLSGDIGS